MLDMQVLYSLIKRKDIRKNNVLCNLLETNNYCANPSFSTPFCNNASAVSNNDIKNT